MINYILFIFSFCAYLQGNSIQKYSNANNANTIPTSLNTSFSKGDNTNYYSYSSQLEKNLYEEKTSTSMKRVWLHFTTFSDLPLTREILLGFCSNTTDTYDYGYEAEIGKLYDNDFGTILDGKIMSIQAFSDITNGKKLPLYYSSCANYTHEIKISRMQNITENQKFFLKDKLTGNYIDLSLETAYTFTSEQGEFFDRFEIVIEENDNILNINNISNNTSNIYYANNINTLFSKNFNTNTCEITFTNMAGQIVLNLNKISQQELSKGLTISKLPSGTYIINAKTDDHQVITKKIIVY